MLLWVARVVGEGEARRNSGHSHKTKGCCYVSESSPVAEMAWDSGQQGVRWELQVRTAAEALGGQAGCLLQSQPHISRVLLLFCFLLIKSLCKVVEFLTCKEFLSLTLKSDSPGSDPHFACRFPTPRCWALRASVFSSIKWVIHTYFQSWCKHIKYYRKHLAQGLM